MMAALARDNPFATHRLDALRYRPQGESWEDMLGRLATMGSRGAVVGPEGSGKTALLHDLAPRLKAIGLRVESLRLGFGQRTLPVDTLRRLSSLLDGEGARLLDGAEQLGPMGWRAVARTARRAGVLVITLHRPGAAAHVGTVRTERGALSGAGFRTRGWMLRRGGAGGQEGLRGPRRQHAVVPALALRRVRRGASGGNRGD